MKVVSQHQPIPRIPKALNPIGTGVTELAPQEAQILEEVWGGLHRPLIHAHSGHFLNA